MKADLPIREPEIQAIWAQSNLYQAILDSRKGADVYLLHDGPPYTNSPIHIGTALNKTLKDFVLRTRTMMGYACPYVPGFDNHGLPIEQAVTKVFQEKGVTPDIATLRQACRDHAQRYIGIQTEQFQRIGILGLWEKPYVTMDYKYEAEIVRTFKRLVEKDQVYRGLRPVMWSPTCQTALADTEIVYAEHTSKAIYVRFPLKNDLAAIFEGYENLYTIIWTTTPWTIPANLAVAYHPEYEYSIVRVGADHYLLVDELVDKTMAKCGFETFERVGKVKGSDIEGVEFKHPVFDRASVAVLADYVTTEDGTGVVHTAPGHGRDDFYTGAKYGLPVLCPVDERGVLTAEAGEFAGTFYKKCDTVVVDRLRELGALLNVEEYVHNYPHAERDNQPVIFRATDQWFVSIDENNLRHAMLEQIDGVSWHPEASISRIRTMVGGRPDWCISRQRPWGVGIPVFYGAESGEPVLDLAVIELVAQLVEREGSDAWFIKPAEEILPVGFVHPRTGETSFRKEQDVFDVWFDSGATNMCVLEGNVEPSWPVVWPADVYFEGSDQHRGWFNTSLVLATAIKGAAPYKSVVTHGFVVDEKGIKMSKRLGNVVDPIATCSTYGADILRYWAGSVVYEGDIACSDNILKQCGEGYRTIRNTSRFLLANLFDYEPGQPIELQEIDRWIIEQTDLLVDDCVRAYEEFAFHRAMNAVLQFCKQELSAFYLDVIKDRMYCDGKEWESRRSGQEACLQVLNRLVRVIAPVLVHTAEEIYARIPSQEKLQSVHMELFNPPTPDRLAEIEGSELQSRFARLFAVRDALNAAFEAFKAGGTIKDSQDAIAGVTADSETVAILRSFGDDLAVYLKFSAVELSVGESGFNFRLSEFEKCERSRLRRPDVKDVQGMKLTTRDARAIGLA